MNNKLFSIGIALLLIVAIADLPYGFYTFLRIVVCSYSVYLVQFGNQRHKVFFGASRQKNWGQNLK